MRRRGRWCTSELPSCCCGRAAIRLSRFTVRQFMCHGQTKIAQKTAREKKEESKRVKQGEGDNKRERKRERESRGNGIKEGREERSSEHAAYSTVRYPTQLTSLETSKKFHL